MQSARSEGIKQASSWSPRANEQTSQFPTTNDSQQYSIDRDSSLIELNPLISKDVVEKAAQIAEVEEESEKCWICFTSEDEEEGKESRHGQWKSPCKCALIAHEGCLLDWIAEMEKESTNDKTIRCPQCKTPIKLTQDRSLVVGLGNGVNAVVRAVVPWALISSCGSILYLACTIYGVHAVYLICGTQEANAILLNTSRAEFLWTWRLGVGLPLIPIVTILSRTGVLDSTLPILPFIFFCNSDPLHFTFPPSPAITLALLPYVRGLYNGFYNKLLLPYDKKWTSQLGRSKVEEDDEAAVIVEEVEVDVEVENDAARLHNNGRQNWNVNNVANRGGGLNIVLKSRDTIEALFFPTIMAGMGTLLGRFSRIRRLLPQPFHRNILGGCLFILIKDLFSLYYKYKRVQQLQSRSIMDYKKSISKGKGKLHSTTTTR